MRTLVLIILSFCLATVVHGQSLTIQVVGSTGGNYSDSVRSLSWTVGEIMVEAFTDSTNFLTQGFQQPWENNLVDTQHIELVEHWSLFSTYINPEDPNVFAVMSNVVSDLIIMKNGSGQAYWPLYGVNVIGDMIIGEGYHVNMAQLRDLIITGTAAIPEETFVHVPLAWSIIGYTRQSSAPIELMLSSIASHVIIVKNSNGLVYWPSFGVNLIGNLDPGKGYQIKSDADTAFYYPPNNQSYSKSIVEMSECSHFPKVAYSESNLTLGIPWQAWDVPPMPGDEIAVYSNSGVLAGSAVFNNQMHCMPVWGDDSYSYEIEGVKENEYFYIVLWHSENNSEEIIIVEDWLEGSSQYMANNICVANKVKHTGKMYNTKQSMLCRNYPNPFNNSTRFEFFIPEPSMVKIEMFGLLGESVEIVLERQFDSGTHEFNYVNPGLAPGTYIYKVSTANQSLTQYLSIMK